MALDLAGARATLTELLQVKTLTVVREEVPYTSLCGLSPRSGSTARDEGVDAERGDYRLTLPAQSALVLLPGESIKVDGRRFRVVWAPARSNLNLSDQYGVVEWR